VLLKSFFNKLFPLSDQVEESLGPQAVPQKNEITDDIHIHQRKALIEWISGRLHLKLPSVQPDPMLQDDTSVASLLVKWTEEDEDVYLRVKELPLSEKEHRGLLELYEEIKTDIGLYMPALHSTTGNPPSEEDEIWQVYRDVIYAVTQRKFMLIRQQEVERYKQGKLLCKATIMERPDIPKAREMAKQSFLDMGIPQTIVMSHLLVISEAITNILKHAREGTMLIVESSSHIYVLVEDRGPGFPLKLLPNTTLMAGYSTKKSLGQGFTLMMKMTELVMLSTIPGEGSTLILVFNPSEGELNHAKLSAGP
jgi:anti-sigma regulatory factor (Ser/Thr protein kinase)